MGLKDCLQLYCEIVSTNELLEKLPPEKVNIIFDKLSENDKIKLLEKSNSSFFIFLPRLC